MGLFGGDGLAHLLQPVLVLGDIQAFVFGLDAAQLGLEADQVGGRPAP
jgi:hypothetical protein